MKTAFYIFFTLTFFISCKEEPSSNTQGKDQVAYHNPMVAPLTAAIEADPQNADLYYQRSLALNKIKQDEFVEKDLLKAISLDSTNLSYRTAIANFLLGINRAKEAVPHIFWLKKKEPQNLEYHLLYAEVLTAQKKLQAAQSLLDSLQGTYGGNPMLLYDYANLEVAKLDTAKALEYAMKAVVAAPAFYDARYLVADLYKGQNNSLAVKWYEDLYRLDTLNASPLYDAAQFYIARKDWEVAKAFLHRSIRTDKDYAEAYLEYGKILLQQDSIAKAERQFDILIDVQPNLADGYYYKGVCAQKKGNQALAKALFHQTLTFNPKHEQAKKALQQFP